jgi:hypothetical protein
MRRWTEIIVHCSDSRYGSAAIIDRWHRDRGWKGIGYHFVILNGQITPGVGDYWGFMDGAISPGRRLDSDNWVEDNEVGAHALGHNESAIGICLIGTTGFSYFQMTALKVLVNEIADKIDTVERLLGHYQVNPQKSCPNFDVGNWAAQNGIHLKTRVKQ